MSVVGFDIGNENCVVAAVKNRGVDVLLNEESNRETPGVVSFGEKQRLFGSAAAASATMNPTSTISQLKRLIGRNFCHPMVQEDLKRFPFATSEGPDGGILIHLQYLGEQYTFTAVQMLAMLLSHLKQMAEKSLEAPIQDCVIGIPSYFTDSQRHLYLGAAQIAGLTPLRLLHDCTATALGYGIYKTEFSNEGLSYAAAFVDIGHSDTQVAIVLFEPGRMRVLSHASDSNLGSRDFDEVLFVHFAEKFKPQYNIDVSSSRRACIRLRAACEKLKKVLSANPEAPLNIECLMDEKDVKGFITREDFEKLSLRLLDGIAKPCLKALTDAGVPLEKILSVELVGSGSRIPAITKVLTSVFRREPSRKLNASECVARGCALQCAMLSPNFRVKEYEVIDSMPFSIRFRLIDDGPKHELQYGVLFPKGHLIPSKKVVKLHKSSDFQMELFYSEENESPPNVSSIISIIKIGPFPEVNTETATVKVEAHLTLHGTLAVQSASLVGDFEDEAAMRGNAYVFSDGMEAECRSFQEENGAEYRYSAQKSGPSACSRNRKDKTMNRPLIPLFEDRCGGISDAEIYKDWEVEAQLAKQDREVEQAKEKKNALESYVYETRNMILSTYKDFTAESEKDKICENLQKTEEWLYEDGDYESADVYTERLQELKKLVDPIENRYKDEEARPQAVENFVQTIINCQSNAQSLPRSERDDVLVQCTKAEQWLWENLQKQDDSPKYLDPIILSSNIENMAKELAEWCRQKVNKKDNAYSDHKSKRDNMDVD